MGRRLLMTEDSESNVATETDQEVAAQWHRVIRRRSFLKGVGVAGASLTAGGLLATEGLAKSSRLTRGDVAILRFLAAAEIIESDLWSQYAALGGAPDTALGGTLGGNPAYVLALQNIDADMPQYITDNTDDELSHAAFLNAYLKSKGAEPVSLDEFRTLPTSKATGALAGKRLTNLQKLNVDTSWYTRYRSGQNPDLGAHIDGPFTIANEPAIPVSDSDTPPGQSQPVPPANPQQQRMQAIANTAAFHFAMIEQGGSSLYTSLSLKVTDLEVLRIVVSIGGVEVDHFSLWHDKVGNTVSQPLAGVTDPETGLSFPDLNSPATELTQTNKILPEPTQFLSKSLPAVSVIRPSSTANAGAVAAIKGLTADQLFLGQSDEFFDFVMKLAVAADSASREL
jgi:hypothetical protein